MIYMVGTSNKSDPDAWPLSICSINVTPYGSYFYTVAVIVTPICNLFSAPRSRENGEIMAQCHVSPITRTSR
jgi:hypothetical protein